MTSVSELTLRPDISILMIHGKLKSHAIIFNPPYDIASILIDFCSFGGQLVKIIIDHSTRDVNIVQTSINRLVLRTVVTAFQDHRLQMPIPRRSIQPTFGNVEFFDGGVGGIPVSRLTFPEMTRTSQGARTHSASRRPRDTGKSCSICMENIFDNDVQVMEVRGKKVLGAEYNSTEIYVERHVIVIE